MHGSGIVEAFRVLVAWSLQILDGLGSSEPQLTAASYVRGPEGIIVVLAEQIG